MAQVPGGPGKQLFGIGIFVAAGIAQDVPAVLYPATAQDQTVVRRELVIYDQTSTPVFIPPPASISSAFGSDDSDTTVVTSRRIYDPTATPVIVPPTPTPSAFAYQPADALGRRQRKVLPDSYVEPAVVPARQSTFANDDSDTVVVTARRVYDQTAARPVFPPVAAAVAVVAPPDAPQSGFVRPRIKPVQLSAFVFAYPVDDLAQDYSGLFIRPIRKKLPDGIAQPPFQPPVVITPSIDSKLAGAYGSLTVVLSRVVYDPTAAPIFKPVPITPTPATLFDNIGPVKVTPPNRTAIRIDLQGAVWPPQNPADLTGIITPPVEPPVVTTPPSGVGRVVGRGGPVYKRLKLKKKLKREECEELLAYLRSLPAQEMQQELIELASRPDIATLLEMMPVPSPVMDLPARVISDDDDEECIALLLELLNNA